MNRVQLSQLAVLSAVAEGRSFRKAAAELGIAPSAVSHAVSSLEASLGLRLLHRTTRSVSPTEEGKRLLETLGPALADIDAVIDTLAEQGGRPAGPLRITLPRLAAEDLIVPRLGNSCGSIPKSPSKFRPMIALKILSQKVSMPGFVSGNISMQI